MKTSIVSTQDFAYHAKLRKLTRPVGAYSLTITSVWRGAKDPTSERTRIQITMDRQGLIDLGDLIDAQVRP